MLRKPPQYVCPAICTAHCPASFVWPLPCYIRCPLLTSNITCQNTIAVQDAMPFCDLGLEHALVGCSLAASTQCEVCSLRSELRMQLHTCCPSACMHALYRPHAQHGVFRQDMHPRAGPPATVLLVLFKSPACVGKQKVSSKFPLNPGKLYAAAIGQQHKPHVSWHACRQ